MSQPRKVYAEKDYTPDLLLTSKPRVYLVERYYRKQQHDDQRRVFEDRLKKRAVRDYQRAKRFFGKKNPFTFGTAEYERWGRAVSKAMDPGRERHRQRLRDAHAREHRPEYYQRKLASARRRYKKTHRQERAIGNPQYAEWKEHARVYRLGRGIDARAQDAEYYYRNQERILARQKSYYWVRRTLGFSRPGYKPDRSGGWRKRAS